MKTLIEKGMIYLLTKISQKWPPRLSRSTKQYNALYKATTCIYIQTITSFIKQFKSPTKYHEKALSHSPPYKALAHCLKMKYWPTDNDSFKQFKT